MSRSEDYLSNISDCCCIAFCCFRVQQGWDAQTSMSGAVESYAVCRVGPSYTAEASWLVSDPIETKEANKLDIHISYSMRKCASLGLTGGNCKDEFDVYFLQTDRDYTSGPDYPGLESFEKVSAMNGSDPSAFSVLVTGKYSFIAFRDNGSCSTLSKVQVMYNVCQEKTLDKSLVTLPRTVAPANDSQTLKVKGNCLEDTMPSTAEELYGICQSNGEWRGSPQQQLGKCLCKAGLMAVGGGCRGTDCFLACYELHGETFSAKLFPPFPWAFPAKSQRDNRFHLLMQQSFNCETFSWSFAKHFHFHQISV